MSRNKIIIIISAVVLLIVALIYNSMEYQSVSDYKWLRKYDFEDKEPYGLFIFKELLSRKFEDIPLQVLDNLPSTDTLSDNDLYIQFCSGYLSGQAADSLIKIAGEGNDVLIISTYFSEEISDTTTAFFYDWEGLRNEIRFNFTDESLKTDSNFVYQFVDRNFKLSAPDYQNFLYADYWEEGIEYLKVVTPDSLILLAEFPIGEGNIFYHLQPDMFMNYSFRQNSMFSYMNKVLSHFQPNHIYLLDPRQVSLSSDVHRNPLEYVMSQPALKAAYFILFFGTLLYAFFGGKRKQKIIPVLAKNENTSLEYIDTVSHLFYQQGQHEKLVRHIKDVFYHKMQKKFFIGPDHSNYVSVLSKKSKISEIELQYIMDRFQNLEDNFKFRGDQLVSLNKRLESIYKEIEKK